ncbi:MAG: hypothetical protein AAFQ91_16800, partial [Cyanobacteria bacterium J06621_15]
FSSSCCFEAKFFVEGNCWLIGSRKRYYQDNQEDALILWLGGIHKPEFQKILTNWKTNVSKRLQKSSWELTVNS